MANITDNGMGFFVDAGDGSPPVFLDKRALPPDKAAALQAQVGQMYGPPVTAAAPANPSPLPDFQAPRQLPADVSGNVKPQPRDLSLSPDGNMFVGVDDKGEPFSMTLEQGKAMAAAGEATLPRGMNGLLADPATTVADDKAKADAAAPPSTPTGIAGQMLTGTVPRPPSGGGEEGLFAKGLSQQQKAIQQGAEIGAQRAAEQSTYAKHMADQADAMAAEQAQKQGDRQRFMDGQMNDLSKMMATFNSQKVDPSHWWASRTSSQKVAAALGMALGAIGQAFTGGPNAAMQIIQSSIDRDIDAQKANLAKGQQDIQNRMTLLGAYRTKFQDDAQAEAATRATMLQAAAKQAEAAAMKYDAPEVKAKAAQLAGDLNTQAAQALDGFKQRAFERSMQTAQLGMHAQEMGLQMANMGKDRYVPGLGYALDKDSAKTLREKKSAFDDVSSKLDRMIQLRQKYGAEMLDRSAVSEMRSLSGQLMLALQRNEGLSRLSDEDIKVLKDIQGGDPTAMGYVLPALQSLKKSVNDGFMSTARTYLDPQLSGSSAGIPVRPLK